MPITPPTSCKPTWVMRLTEMTANADNASDAMKSAADNKADAMKSAADNKADAIANNSQ